MSLYHEDLPESAYTATELKPTTREEREQWKKNYAIYSGVWYYPHQTVIERLIADVERLEGLVKDLRGRITTQDGYIRELEAMCDDD